MKTLRELPAYWQMMMNSRASKKLMNARIRAMVFLAQGLELRVEALNKRIGQLKHENVVLQEEIALLRSKKLVWRSTPIPKREGPRERTLGPRETPMSDRDSTPFETIYEAVVGAGLRGNR